MVARIYIYLFAFVSCVAMSCLFAIAAGDQLPKFCVPVSPQFGPLGYQKRDDNRCEGLYNPAVSAPSIEILSATLESALPSKSAQVVTLQVPGLGVASNIHVVGRSLVPDVDYRLDALLTLSEPILKFSVDIAKRSGLDLSQIGFWGQEDATIVPVALETPDTAVLSINPPKMRMIIQTALLADRIAWRWESPCDGNWHDLPGNVFTPDAPIAIEGISLSPTSCNLTVLATAQGRVPKLATWPIKPAARQ